MKSFQLVTILAFFALVAAACSSRGLPNLGGLQCPASYANEKTPPFPKDMGKNQSKVWGKGSSETGIPAGTYDYTVGDLIYTDKKTGIIVQVHEERNKAGVLVANIYCVRGAEKVDIRQITPAGIQGASKLALNSKNVETRVLGFDIVNGALAPKVTAGPIVDNLEKAYSSPDNSDLFLMKTTSSAVDYQVRSYGSDENGTYQMQMQFKKQ